MALIANVLWQFMVISHRYLGVAVGLLMAMWFVSGMIMMYVGLPRVDEEARARTLRPISWGACCHYGTGWAAEDEPIPWAQVENLAGSPVMRIQRSGQVDMPFNLARGATTRIDTDQAQAIAFLAAPRIIGKSARGLGVEYTDIDQWTVGRLARDRPFYRVLFDDSEATNIYVSGKSGQVVLWTTEAQRFWNWFGTIPHFLYFTKLRSNVALWSQVVIWTATLGTFLTVFGLCLGIVRFRSGGKLSPYRGLLSWHHLIGLVFGLVTLTWVASGLVSMNPAGFLEGRRGDEEQTRIRGTAPTWGNLRTSLEGVRTRASVAQAVSLVTAPLAGELYWLATLDDGNTVRLNAAGDVAVPSKDDLAQAARRVAGAAPITEHGLTDKEDAYYFKRRGERLVLPVYRMILGDADATRYYLDPSSGLLLQRIGANDRWHRWLFGALHRIDFAAWMRARPLWDIVVLCLLLGGFGVSATGVYLAIRRMRDDVVRLFDLARGRRMPPNPASRESGIVGTQLPPKPE